MSNILKGLNESNYRNYDNNRTGFSRGQRDDERHDLDVQQPSQQQWALKINGKVWSKDGNPVTFDSKEKALKARQSLLAKRPELEVGLVTRGGVAEAGTGLDIDRSIPGRTIARVSDKANTLSSKAKTLPSFMDRDDYDPWSGKIGASIHDDEEDTFDTDYTGDEEGELNEISNEKLAQYKTAAALDAGQADKEGDYKRGDKRFSGIIKATKKQFANDEKKSAIGQGLKEADDQKEFILYVNGKPAAKYVDQMQAEKDMSAVKKKHPQTHLELKHEVCNLQTLKRVNESVVLGRDEGNFVGDTPVNLGGVVVKNLGIGDIVSYFGQKAKIVAMSKTGNTSRITIPSGMGGVTKDVLTKDLKRTSLSEEELDEACWKGYHKEGNKKMFGKTYPNCVKNTNEDSLNEFAPDGFNGGDGEEFNPRMAKMAYDEGVVKGASLADGATTQRAMAINDWDKHDGGIYAQHFAKGFKAGRMDKIRHNNKQYNLNLKLMKDGSIRHGEQELDEYGDTAKGQKMLDKVHHRAADRVVSKKADTDPQYARKSQQTQDRAHDRLKDVAEGAPELLKQEMPLVRHIERELAQHGYEKGTPEYNEVFKHTISMYRQFGNVDAIKKGVAEDDAGDVEQRMIAKIEKEKQRLAKLKQTDPEAYKREMAKRKTSSRIPPVSTFEDQSVAEEQLDEKWTKKYKDSINCSNPKGFSQKAHCAGKQKNESAILKGLK